MNQAKLIKKLRLKRGCEYLLFIPTGVLHNEKDMFELNKVLLDTGFGNIIVAVKSTKGIKVVEKEDGTK